MSIFVTFKHVIMLRMKVPHCAWCSFHELFEENVFVPSRTRGVFAFCRLGNTVCVASKVIIKEH